LALRIKPYILAGGKSSRMGRDKAMLEFEGKTLLARTVESVRSVRRLQLLAGGIEVTVCGEREALEGADRAIVDHYASCGPLGGIEAALSDLGRGDDADWAFFIPVDMPLLSVALIDQLLVGWTEESTGNPQIRACLVEVEGTLQPLVSLVHRSGLRLVREALEAKRYKVVPVLQSVGACCASFDQGPTSQDEMAGAITPWIGLSRIHSTTLCKQVDPGEWPFYEFRDQFINVNTEADLMRVATLLSLKGS
jgi:molybdopterin-guanine dinucleotide biosynthesis protein A